MKKVNFKLVLSYLAALSITLLALPTWADVPPPEDYVETCTLEAQTESGAECVECDADFETNTCADMYEAEGFTKSCQTWGASVWTEVWCKPGAEAPEAGAEAPEAGAEAPEAGAEVPEATAQDSEEGCSQLNQTPMAIWLGFMVLSLITLRRRSTP